MFHIFSQIHFLTFISISSTLPFIAVLPKERSFCKNNQRQTIYNWNQIYSAPKIMNQSLIKYFALYTILNRKTGNAFINHKITINIWTVSFLRNETFSLFYFILCTMQSNIVWFLNENVYGLICLNKLEFLYSWKTGTIQMEIG